MKSKWYISTLLLILALIGLNQERHKVANQQIVLQFTEVETTLETAHDAISTLTEKLEALGVVNIEIVESDDNARFSIRYYSTIDAQSVEEFLSQHGELALLDSDIDKTPVDFPTEELPETCSLVVSDLQQSSHYGSKLNGNLVVDAYQDYKQFSNLKIKILPFTNAIRFEADTHVKVAYKINSGIAVGINTTSSIIPEVRAGPSRS